jgi:hypothetical protein
LIGLETVKLQEQSIEGKLHDIDLFDDLLRFNPKSTGKKSKD